MGQNAYFQLVNQPDKTLLKVYPASDNGEMFKVDEVAQYFDVIRFDSIDLAGINNYLKRGDFSTEYCLVKKKFMPENEVSIIRVVNMGEKAVARFYPPTKSGKRLTKEDVLSDLKRIGVVHGIQEDVIDDFIANPKYCTDYEVAVATAPIQGKDAVIEYHFDVSLTAKPKLNEDGSVDFHQLGNIRSISAGDKLATLTPADRGKPGITVTGAPLPPNKVNVKVLRYGRNISISEDKCTIYSDVSGHVSLVDDLVMVSNIYEVPANVDASTGDITYNGTVHVVGNVNTGYSIKAAGDIVVNGVVEGAVLTAGGNIVLKRGMQGMSRGKLKAAGNITAKFIENSEVRCEGTLMCDAVLHSNVECNSEISVLGKKGLINGGHICSRGCIQATQLGSMMGTSTVIEILSDVEPCKRLNETQQKITETEEGLQKMNQVLAGIKKMIQSGQQISPKQVQYLKLASVSKPKLVKEIQIMKEQCILLEKIIETGKNAFVRVEGNVNPGVKIVIKDISRIYRDSISKCKFIREGADIKSVGIY